MKIILVRKIARKSNIISAYNIECTSTGSNLRCNPGC